MPVTGYETAAEDTPGACTTVCATSGTQLLCSWRIREFLIWGQFPLTGIYTEIHWVERTEFKLLDRHRVTRTTVYDCEYKITGKCTVQGHKTSKVSVDRVDN